MFDGTDRICDCIHWWESENGYYYDGIIYFNCFRIVDDPRKIHGFKNYLGVYDPSKAEKEG